VWNLKDIFESLEIDYRAMSDIGIDRRGRASAPSFRVFAFEARLLVGKELHRQSNACLAAGDFKNFEYS
jgi:hypothetical protein